MNNYTDIVRGVRQHDAKAQMAFYDLFAKTTYQSAIAVVGNSDEAEEIMQDCILKIFQKTALLHDDAAAMKRFASRMAVNRAIDALRKRKDFVVAIDTYETVDCEDDAEEHRALCVDDVREGVNRLPDLYRSIIALRLFHEISFDEIAAQLQAKPSTIRVQYTRGITKLRHYLNQKYE